jgi:hypothetical protein
MWEVKTCTHDWIYFNFHTKRRCQACGLMQEWDADTEEWVNSKEND